MARWGGWGAQGLWQVFDEKRPEYQSDREQLRQVLSDAEYTAARRTTINAHYTDPAIAGQVWRAVDRLGFAAGRVLEPGCGVGTFIGLAPGDAQAVGVELDPTTAAIAQALYPHAEIRAESFADTRLPADMFDLAIGNVPFADITLHDPRHNVSKHRMHNHFIIKSLGLTRPGGMVAVLTSQHTMDARNPSARREMNELADLVAAVRLPSGAHRRAAGTDVVTDLLILRRREPGQAPQDRSWEVATPVPMMGPAGAEEPVSLNTYWQTHPEHVLGQLSYSIGLYGQPGITVTSDITSVGVRLGAALDQAVDDALQRGLGFAPRTETQQVAAAAYAPAHGLADGQVIHIDGEFKVADEGQLTPLTVPKNRTAEVQSLLELRDQARALIAAESATVDDTAELDQTRAALAAAWTAYVDRYGAINRFTEARSSRTDPDTGEPAVSRRTHTAARLMKTDPWFPLVQALEVFDDTTQSASPAGILLERQIVPRKPVQGVENARDGLAVVLDTHGHVDIDEIARLLGADRDSAIAELGEAVFQVPGADEQWVTRAEYLSGNVRVKLDAAREAALAEPGVWDRHVHALQDVLPDDVLAGDITPKIGASWIPDSDHQTFLRELLRNDRVRVRRLGGAEWESEFGEWGIPATQEWGTERIPAGKLLALVASQKPIIVTDPQREGPPVVNPTETAAAVEKARQLEERFADWVWEDADRSVRLVERYNRLFNSIVLREYQAEGQALTLPGLVKTFVPRDHQRAAVARMLAEPSVGLFHEVGAGKTAEMVIGTMELKRLGLVTKPAVCVPNHMLEQFSREWLQLYPQARLLAASSADLTGDSRRRFVARVATNDWDAIILTRGAFHHLPLQPDNEAAFLDSQLEETRVAIENANRTGSSAALRRMEKKLARREEVIKAKRDMPRDPGVSFEETGIDYLVVDELHEYKNLDTVSSITEARIAGSQRAMDLYAKVGYLRATTNSNRVLTGATATPIANSVAEMHVMQRYLDPDGLAAAEVSDFDTWAATFGLITQNLELSVAGGSTFKPKTRLAKFTNVPELQTMFRRFADVKTAQDLDLPKPDLAARPDGVRAPRVILVPKTPAMSTYIANLAERAETASSQPGGMLVICTDGRKAALDLRLVNPAYGAASTKIEAAADELHKVWLETHDRTYTNPATGEPSPTPGALQIVFCDYGTPSDQWNVYDGLKDALIARGVPAERIRFVHDAKSDADKARLFEACRNGAVSIIIGSTSKMGVGTNIQRRAVHLMDLDAPWRPADVEQRHGRILRQGNQNAEVAITQVVTEGSFDTFMWQTLERKGRFIDQIMTGKSVGRETGDVGDSTMSYAEVKAISSGNPLLLTLAEAEQELQRLTRLERSHATSQRSLQAQLTRAAERIGYIDRTIPQLDAAQARTISTKGDAFAVTFGDGRTYTDRAAAATRLQQEIHAGGWVNPVVTIAGHRVHLDTERAGFGEYVDRWTIPDAPGVERAVRWSENEPRNALGTITRLENLADQIGPTRIRLLLDRAEAERTIESGTPLQGRPFKHTEDLTRARATYRDVQEQIQELANQPTAGEPSSITDVGCEPHMPTGLAQRLAARAASLGPAASVEQGRAAAGVALEPHPRSVSPSIDGPDL